FAIPTRLSWPTRKAKNLPPSRPYFFDDGVCVNPVPPQQFIANHLCAILMSKDCYRGCFHGRRWPVAKLADLIFIAKRNRKLTLQRALTTVTAWFHQHGYHLHTSIEDGQIGFAVTLASEPEAVKMRQLWLAEAYVGSGGPPWMADCRCWRKP